MGIALDKSFSFNTNAAKKNRYNTAFSGFASKESWMVKPAPTEERIPSENGAGSMHWAWFAVMLLWPVALLNYMDRQMLAAMKSSVMADIPSILNQEAWGTILGQFKWSYALMSPIGGYLADRVSRRLAICISLFVWSAVTWMTGHVDSYNELLWARTLMGISEAFYIPAALALIAELHSRGTRSRAVGIHQTAFYCGVILGGFSGYVADAPAYGWRFAFDAAGIIGMCYALPLVWMLHWQGGAKTQLLSQGVKQNTVGWQQVQKELFFNPSFLILVACFTLPAFPGWVVRDWMPDILKERFNIGQGKAGVSATLFYSLASIAAAFVGGYLADRWRQRNQRGRIYMSAIGISLLAPALFGVGYSGSLTMAVCFLILFGVGWGLFDCNNMPILSQIVKPELRATAYGFMNLISISCGGFADKLFGKLRDAKVPLEVSFGIFAAVALGAAFLILFIRPRAELANGSIES